MIKLIDFYLHSTKSILNNKSDDSQRKFPNEMLLIHKENSHSNFPHTVNSSQKLPSFPEYLLILSVKEVNVATCQNQ